MQTRQRIYYVSFCAIGKVSSRPEDLLARKIIQRKCEFKKCQRTSAETAARGQMILSRFSGPDCSVHKSCCPIILKSVSEQIAQTVITYHRGQVDIPTPSDLQVGQMCMPENRFLNPSSISRGCPSPFAMT